MSFASVLDAVVGCETPVDGSGLASALAVGDRYEARTTVAVGEFVVGREWKRLGYANATQWLKAEARMTGADAYRTVQTAKKIRHWPVLTAAWLDGVVSSGQVHVICQQVIDRHVRLFAEHESWLVANLSGLSIDDTTAAMRLWRQRADALDDGPEPAAERTEVTLSSTLDDRGLLHGTLDAEAFALTAEALALADPKDFDLSAPERRGLAFMHIMRFFLDRQTGKTVRKQRPHVNVVITAETLGTPNPEATYAGTGMPVAQHTLDKFLCDCDLHRMLHADGEVLDYGRAERTAPAPLFNALAVRDGGCRAPGCDRPPSDCQVHHPQKWEAGGHTNEHNTVLGCDQHHDLWHLPGWRTALTRDGTFTVTDPNGISRSTRPRVVTIEHVRVAITHPNAAENLDDPPAIAHANHIAQEIGARRRINALVDQARLERALVNLISLGTRPGMEFRQAG